MLLTADPAIRERISWNIPFYSCHKQHVCYLNVIRAEPLAVDLAFLQGTKLSDEAGLLESRGRKNVKSIVIRKISDWDEDLLRSYIQEAILLTENRAVQ